MSLNPRNTDGHSYDWDLLELKTVCSDRSLSTVFIFGSFSFFKYKLWNCYQGTSFKLNPFPNPCPTSPGNGSKLSGYGFVFQKIKLGDSLTPKVLLKMDTDDGTKKKQSPLKQWQNSTNWEEKKIARHWGRRFSPFVTYSSKGENV